MTYNKKLLAAAGVGALVGTVLATKKGMAQPTSPLSLSSEQNCFLMYFDHVAGDYKTVTAPRIVVEGGESTQTEYVNLFLNSINSPYRTQRTELTTSRNARNLFRVGFSQTFLLNTNYDENLNTNRPLWAMCINRADSVGSLDLSKGSTASKLKYRAMLYAEWVLDQNSQNGGHPGQSLSDVNAERLSLCNIAYIRARKLKQAYPNSISSFGKALDAVFEGLSVNGSKVPYRWSEGAPFMNRYKLMRDYGENVNGITESVAEAHGFNGNEASILKSYIKDAKKRFDDFYNNYYWGSPILTPNGDHFIHPSGMETVASNWITNHVASLVGKALIVNEYENNPAWVTENITEQQLSPLKKPTPAP